MSALRIIRPICNHLMVTIHGGILFILIISILSILISEQLVSS